MYQCILLINLFLHALLISDCQEAEKVATVFEQVAPDLVKFDSPCDVMKGLAEVIKVSDVEFISLEVHRLLRR